MSVRRPMRIGIDIRSTQNGSGVRGIGRYVYDVVDGLSRYAPDNDYFLFTFPDRALPDRLGNLPPNCHIVPVKTREVDPVPREGQESLKLKLWWWLRCEASARANARSLSAVVRQGRLDVIHLTNVFEGYFFTHGKYPCRVVKTVHDAIPLVLPDLFVNVWPYRIRTMYRRQAAAVAPGADRICAVSESAKRDAVEYLNVAPAKATVVYNSVGESFVKNSSNAHALDLRGKYGIDSPFFLYCGGGGPNKNRERMVRAFAGLAKSLTGAPTKCQMVIAGPQTGDEEQLQTLIRESCLPDDRLRILGFVPDDDLVALMATAVGVLMATLYEGFGLPAAQALQLGTPVVGADRGSLPEVIGNAGLLVDPYDIDAIKRAMARLLSEPGLRNDLATLGPAQAAKFSLQRQAAEHIALYREVLGRP